MKPKPSFALRVKSKDVLAVKRRLVDAREQELEYAVKWCQDNNSRGYAAISSGLFTIKDAQTINKRLDGDIVIGKTMEFCSILSIEEEEAIVRYAKNKNRYNVIFLAYSVVSNKGMSK